MKPFNHMCYWVGCAVLGSVYLIAFEYSPDALPFILSQVLMGLIGARREVDILKIR